MKKQILATISILALVSCISYSAYAYTNSKTNTINNDIISNPNVSNKTNSAIDLKDMKIKQELIKDKDKMNEIASFKIKKPTIDLGNLKEVINELKKETVNENDPNFEQEFNTHISVYQGNKDEKLIIAQSETNSSEELSPANLKEKTIVNGVTAYICEVEGGPTQIMFVKDKTFYNISGYTIPKGQLLKIAESLQ